MSQWYYGTQTGQQGPVSFEQLAQWAQAGQFGPQIMVWREGMADWAQAGAVPELASLFGGGGQAVAGYAQPQQGYPQQAYPQQQAYGYHQQGYAAPLGYAQPMSAMGYPGQYPMRYAGFWWRFVAAFVDGLVLLIPNQIITFVVGMAMDISSTSVKPFSPEYFSLLFASSAATMVVDWLYFAWQESSVHQATLGKRACGIVVTDVNGQRLTFGRATGRYWAKKLDDFTLLIGYMMAGWTEKKQALHDKLAGTLVWKKN